MMESHNIWTPLSKNKIESWIHTNYISVAIISLFGKKNYSFCSRIECSVYVHCFCLHQIHFLLASSTISFLFYICFFFRCKFFKYERKNEYISNIFIGKTVEFYTTHSHKHTFNIKLQNAKHKHIHTYTNTHTHNDNLKQCAKNIKTHTQ